MAALNAQPRTSDPEIAGGGPGASSSVAEQLVAWQATGSEATLETLIHVVRPRLQAAVEKLLRQRGIRDMTAVDDTLSLVLDHLRRLPGVRAGERTVGKFLPRAGPSGGPAGGDQGIAYLERLARSRAIDVARRRKRRDSVVFSELRRQGRTPFEETIIGGDAIGTTAPALRDLVCEAARQLEPRQQLLIKLLLAGKSQALIAHVLEVNEGTVSRLRARAIAAIRQILEAANR